MPGLKRSITLLVGVAAQLLVGAAQAQDQPVTVQLSEVSTALAAQMGLASSIVPSAVQLPLEEAATACGMDAAALAKGPPTCAATTPTPELQSHVLDLIASGDTPAGGSGG